MSTAERDIDCGWMVITGIPTPDSSSRYADVRDKYPTVVLRNVKQEPPIPMRFRYYPIINSGCNSRPKSRIFRLSSQRRTHCGANLACSVEGTNYHERLSRTRYFFTFATLRDASNYFVKFFLRVRISARSPRQKNSCHG